MLRRERRVYDSVRNGGEMVMWANGGSEKSEMVVKWIRGRLECGYVDGEEEQGKYVSLVVRMVIKWC